METVESQIASKLIAAGVLGAAMSHHGTARPLTANSMLFCLGVGCGGMRVSHTGYST